MLDTNSPKLMLPSFKINVQKSCNFDFKHKSKRISTNLTLQGHLKSSWWIRLPGCCVNEQPDMHW